MQLEGLKGLIIFKTWRRKHGGNSKNLKILEAKRSKHGDNHKGLIGFHNFESKCGVQQFWKLGRLFYILKLQFDFFICNQ
jgi:hypothetical protein